MSKRLPYRRGKNDDTLWFDPEQLSICWKGCMCATHTMSDDTCGKCGAWKGDYKPMEGDD